MSSVSARQQAANRRNAKLSTGPKTEAGKQRSSRNAVTHGIFAEEMVLEGEDVLAFQQLKASLIRRLNPRDVLELQYADQVVSASWRLNRLRAAEKHAYEQHATNQMDAVPFLGELWKGFVDEAEIEAEYESEFDEETDDEFEQIVEELKQTVGQSDEPIVAERPTPGRLLTKMIQPGPTGGATSEIDRLVRYEVKLQSMRDRALKELELLKRNAVYDYVCDFAEAIVQQNEPVKEIVEQNEPISQADECNDTPEEELPPVEHGEYSAMDDRPEVKGDVEPPNPKLETMVEPDLDSPSRKAG